MAKSKLKIIEGVEVVNIDVVKANEYNPKKDFNETPEGQKEYGRIKKSLEYHGQSAPILVREIEGGYEIIDGFHRVQAMKELGFKQVEIKNLGKVSREEAIKITLSIEETGIELDPIMKAGLLKELVEMDYPLEGLPYTLEEITAQVELLKFDMQSFEEQASPDKKTREIECPNCHEKFNL